MKPAFAFSGLAICTVAVVLAACTAVPEAIPERTTEAAEFEAPAGTKAEVKTLEFKIRIDAPVEKVWDTMLSPEHYTEWTAPFAAGAYFEGSWSEGERINFLAPGGSGMAAVIAVNRRHEFISIKHLGYVTNGVEDTTSESVRSWAPAYENYRFASVPGGTEILIEQEVIAGFEAMMNDMWPKALALLKVLCESN